MNEGIDRPDQHDQPDQAKLPAPNDCRASGEAGAEHRHRGHVVPGTDTAPADPRDSGEELKLTAGSVELALARMLRIGVFASLILIGLGIAVALMQGLPQIESRTAEPISPRSILAGLRAVSGEAIIDLGLLVLIATPVLRVFAAFILFTRLRDRAFTWLTLSVLVILIGSFLAGRIDGERTSAAGTQPAGSMDHGDHGDQADQADQATHGSR